MTGKQIKTAIIVDFMGSGDREPEDEVREHTERFNVLLAPDSLLVHTPVTPADIEPRTELVLYDFGGFLPGAEDTVRHNVRAMIRWAEDHSSALVIIVSGFTFTNWIGPEMEELGLTLPNIIEDNCDNPIPEWWIGRPMATPKTVKAHKLRRPGPPNFNKR